MTRMVLSLQPRPHVTSAGGCLEQVMRKIIGPGLILVALLFATGADASGGHRHWRGSLGYGWGGYPHSSASLGLYYGDPFFWGPYYDPFPPPYYYTPRTVIIERDPPVYVQRPQTPAPTSAPAVWYYCPEPAGYYPHIPTCSQAWVPVDPSTLPPPPTP